MNSKSTTKKSKGLKRSANRAPSVLNKADHDEYDRHLADLTSYAQAQQRIGELYSDPGAWARKAIINVACSGKFSSDRTINEYAAEIWNAMPCPVE